MSAPPYNRDPFPRILLTAVIEAVTTSFEPFCGENPVSTGLVKPTAEDFWITTSIPFKGSPPWVLSLLFPLDTALAFTQAFAGMEIPADSPDMNDAVGELVNVLAGHVIERLDVAGRTTKMTLPSVARAEAFNLEPPEFERQLFLSYKCPHGRFWLRVGIAPDPTAGTPPPG